MKLIQGAGLMVLLFWATQATPAQAPPEIPESVGADYRHLLKGPWSSELIDRLYISWGGGRSLAEIAKTLESVAESNEGDDVASGMVIAALVFEKAGKTGETIRLLEKAGDENPESVSLILELATLQESWGLFDAALRLLERAKKADETGQVEKRIGQLLFRLNRLDDSLARVQMLGEAGLMTEDEIRGIIELLLAMGEFERAAGLASDASARQPDDPSIAFLLGFARMHEGKHENAARAFVKVLSLTQPHPEALENEERMYSPEANDLRALLNQPSPEFPDSIRSRRHALRSFSQVTWGGSPDADDLILSPGVEHKIHFQALKHLDTVMGQLPAPVRAEIGKELRKTGVPEHQARWMEAGLASTRSWPRTVFEKFPDDPVALEITAVDQWWEPRQSALVFEAITQFREPRPELAILAALSGLRLPNLEGEELSRLFGAVREIAPTVERPDRLHLRSWSKTAQWLLVSNEAPELAPEDRALIADLGVRWYRRASFNIPLGQVEGFMDVASGLTAESEQPQFLEMVRIELSRGNVANEDREIAVLDESTYHHITQSIMLPMTVADRFSAALVSVALVRDRFGGYYMSENEAGLDQAFGRIDPNLSKNRIFRFLMTRNGEAEVAAANLEAMLADESLGVDRYLVAYGYWTEVKPELEKAAEILERALEDLPENRWSRWGIALAGLEFGRNTGRKDFIQRSADILTDEPLEAPVPFYLGQVYREAEVAFPAGEGAERPRHERFPAPSEASLTAASVFERWLPGSEASDSADSISKLVEAGEIDRAADWALIEMQPVALAMLISGSYGARPMSLSDPGHPVTRVILENEPLRAAALKRLTPHGDDPIGLRESATRGRLHELLGDEAEAEKFFDAILAEYPLEDGIRLRKIAAMLSRKSEFDSILAQIRLLDESSIERLGGLFTGFDAFSPDPDRPPPEDRDPFGLVSHVLRLLEIAAEDEWVRDVLLKELARDIQWAESELMHDYRYRLSEAPPPGSDRQKRCERFLRARLPFPDHTGQSLSLLAAISRFSDLPPPDDLWPMYLDLLQNHQYRNRAWSPGGTSDHRNGFQVLSFPELGAFLAREAGAEKDLRAAIREWEGQPDLVGDADILAFFADLYFVDAGEFADTLEELVLKPLVRVRGRKGKPHRSPLYWSEKIKHGFRIAGYRGLDLESIPIYAAAFERRVPSVPFVEEELRRLLGKGREKEAVELLELGFQAHLEAAERAKVSGKRPDAETIEKRAVGILELPGGLYPNQPLILKSKELWTDWSEERARLGEPLPYAPPSH